MLPSASASLLNIGGKGLSWAETTTVATVDANEFESELSLMEQIGLQLASLSLAVGDEMFLSIAHLISDAPSDAVIVGDSLSLPVLAEVIIDSDNDGLDDSLEPDSDNPDPGALGPVARAEFVEGTGGGADEVSLSLGNVARSLALAECGGVTLTLTLMVEEDGSTVTGCGGETRTLAATLTNRVMAQFGPGTYQFFDLLATFDSGQADPAAFLLITLPLPPAEPQTEYRIYRFDGTEWVPVVDADPSSGSSGLDSIGPGIQGATVNGADSEGFSFYAFDFDRDGSVPLLLLVESVPVVPEAPSLEVDPEYQDRLITIDDDDDDAGMPRTLLVPLVGLAASFTARVTGSANVHAEVQTATNEAGSVVYSVKLTGLKRTKNGPEEVVIVAFDEDGNAVATTRVYVAVANQAPAIEFFRVLSDGGRGEQITATLELEPNSEMEVIVEIYDPDGDESFVLGLTGDSGEIAKSVTLPDGGIAEFVPRLSLVAGVPQVTNILILTAGASPRSPFEVALTATRPKRPE